MFYPVYLNIKGKECVVVGGGRVALRKVNGLLDSGALVTVISPDLHADLAALFDQGLIFWRKKKYSANDIETAFLVIAATDDIGAQDTVLKDAERFNILLNVADVPDKCNFILPARVQRGSLSISVSTGGKSPALAKMLRRKLERELDKGYAALNEIMGCIRPEVLARNLPQSENERIFTDIVESEILEHLAAKDCEAVLALVSQFLGSAISAQTSDKIRQIIMGC